MSEMLNIDPIAAFDAFVTDGEEIAGALSNPIVCIRPRSGVASPPSSTDVKHVPANDPPPPAKSRKRPEAVVKLPEAAADMTDAWHARRFVDHYGDRLRFCPDWNKWLEYDGKRWHRDGTLVAQNLAIELVNLLREHIKKIRRPAEREEFLAAVRRAESSRAIAAIAKLAQSDPRIVATPQQFDDGDFTLNCANGTLDLKTSLLRPHDPADMLTKLAPINYVPSAQSPTWDRFLDRIMDGDQEMISFIQRALGYALTADVREECMFVFYGLGQNGKSKLLGAAQAIVGDYGGVAESRLLTLKVNADHPTEIASLSGKRLVVLSEPNECRFDESRVKWLTGGDTITSRKMFKDFSEFRPTHKIVVMSNHKPQVRELSVAYWRRVNLVEFSIQIPPEERDNDLPRKLMAEAEGVLAWMVRGCLEWQRKGLAPPTKVQDATKAYRDEMDPIGEFITEFCVTGLDYRATTSGLYAAYRDWCGQRRVDYTSQMSTKEFAIRLEQKGFESVKSSGIMMRRGIALKPVGEPEMAELPLD